MRLHTGYVVAFVAGLVLLVWAFFTPSSYVSNGELVYNQWKMPILIFGTIVTSVSISLGMTRGLTEE